MNFADTIRSSLTAAEFVANAYLTDLTDAEILVRPTPDANHVAWQLGHVITAEARLVAVAAPSFALELRAGFAERHSADAAGSDNPEDFLTKEEYLAVARQVRENTLVAVASMSDADADRPVSGKLPPFVTRAGDAMAVIGPHWIGHAGQWAVLRRKLGRARMF